MNVAVGTRAARTARVPGRGSRRLAVTLAARPGTARSRSATAAQSSSVSVGVTVKTSRTECAGEWMLLTARRPSLGLVHGEFGGEPLAQQPRAAPLDVAVGAGPALGLVEPCQRRARQLGQGLLAGGREVGQPARSSPHAEVRTGDRVEGDEVVDVGVGDLSGQWVLDV